MNKISVFDAHCDTISEILDQNEDLYKNSLSFSLENIKGYKNYTQIFAAFVSPTYVPFNSVKRTLNIIDTYYKQIEINNKYIAHANSYKEMIEIHKSNKLASFLSIEGGEAINNDLYLIDIYYRLGVRFITLTWEFKNNIATGNYKNDNNMGLSSFGKQVISKLNEIGMVIDLSHISEKGFWDVNKYTKKPYILSHSNSKEICDHPRNINKEQFKALVKAKGVIGINFCPLFLNKSNKASSDDIIKHIEFFMAEGGEDAIGLGSDFDGIDICPCDINNPKNLDIIFNKLLKLNYSEMQVKKIAGLNFENFVKNNLIWIFKTNNLQFLIK